MTLEFNKRYTWKEIAEAYPDMYAIYSTADDEFDPVEGVISCVLLDVCPYEKRDEAFRRALNQYGSDICMERTTENELSFFNGVIFW